MTHTKKEIAESFSNGKFENTYPYLSDNIIWNVVGENIFKGKQEVIAQCNQITEYFNSVETDFQTQESIIAENRVIVRGTGEFLRNGKRVNLITACDVYEFNNNGELEKISSYCIPENK